MEQDLTQLEVTGCDEADDYFATEADTMLDIVCEVGLNKDKLLILTFYRNIYLIVLFKYKTIIFYFIISMYFCIICIWKYMK